MLATSEENQETSPPTSVPEVKKGYKEGDLDCYICGKHYKTTTWVQKHIRDKHDVTDPPKVKFSTPTDLNNYVKSLSMEDPGLVQPIATPGTAEAGPIKVPFKIPKEQAIAFIKTFNQFLDNIISLLVKLDILHYSKTSKANVEAMSNAISVYLDHSDLRVTPGIFLLWNFMLIYGSITLELPGVIRKERDKIEAARLKKQPSETDKQTN